VHLSPLIVFYVIHTPEFAKSMGATVCSNHFGCYFLNKPCSMVFNFSKLLLNTFYVTFTIFTYRELVRGKDRIGVNERLDRQWARILIGAAFTLNLVIVAIRLFEVSQIQIFTSKLFVINIAATVFVLIFSFIGVNFRNLYTFMHLVTDYFSKMRVAEKAVYNCITDAIGVSCEESEAFGISEALMDRYVQIVKESMEKRKLYLEHQLTKSDLSKKLKIPEHHLGAVLKIRIGMSFNDFINSYRLADLLQKLSDSSNDNYTLLGLAYDCGFNSKSTFNRYFKSQMGVTPSEWMRNSGKNIETSPM